MKVEMLPNRKKSAKKRAQKSKKPTIAVEECVFVRILDFEAFRVGKWALQRLIRKNWKREVDLSAVERKIPEIFSEGKAARGSFCHGRTHPQRQKGGCGFERGDGMFGKIEQDFCFRTSAPLPDV